MEKQHKAKRIATQAALNLDVIAAQSTHLNRNESAKNPKVYYGG
jgi:hypothetical protein